ncbi:MAG TPA: hypothetical protein DCQ93_03335 [Bacteroidetes bacterium]|nr:hypothetical protein [Bacteroidota bacterium]
MKKIFATLILVCSLAVCRAQWVTIPDPNFVAWLQAHCSSGMNGNLMDTTSGYFERHTSGVLIFIFLFSKIISSTRDSFMI